MNKNVLSFVVIAIMVISALIVFQDPPEQTTESKDDVMIKELKEENERLIEEISRLEEDINALEPIAYQDFLDAKSKVEGFVSTETVEEAKLYFSGRVEVNDNGKGNYAIYFNTSTNGNAMMEWVVGRKLELTYFSSEDEKIVLGYKDEYSDYKFIMVEENGWKIDEIRWW